MFVATITIIILILFATILYRGNKNTHTVIINEIKVENNESGAKKSPLRILHISDMHLENISVSPNQLMQDLRDQSIDLIALTGDFMDRKKSIPKLIPYLKVFQELKPKYGTFAVFGNHDYVLSKENFNQLKALLKEYGVVTLQNENKTVQVNGEAFQIIGIDNFGTGHSNLTKSFDGVEQGYRLVLTHDPNIVLKMSDYYFDYLLSGHFHGGQIHWPKPYHLKKMGELVSLNMVKGLHEHNGCSFYISEGLGQTGLNIRIGSRPEITFHHLQVGEKEIEAKKIVSEDESAVIAG